MLNIIIELDRVQDKISSPSDYFDANYENSWLNSPLAKEIIKGIDKSDHIKDSYIESPVLGAIPPHMLSGGCKGCLILLNEPDVIIRGESFGDNCFPWLSRIGEEKDITITMHHFLNAFSSTDFAMTARIVNSGKIIHSADEFSFEMLRICEERDKIDREKGVCYDKHKG